MSKHNHIDLVELRASSPEERAKLTAFYSAVFGWAYKDWGETYSDTSDSGLTSGVDVDPERPNATLPVVYSENLEKSKQMVESTGGTIIRDTYEFPGGRRFHFTDPAGNEVAIWSDK